MSMHELGSASSTGILRATCSSSTYENPGLRPSTERLIRQPAETMNPPGEAVSLSLFLSFFLAHLD